MTSVLKPKNSAEFPQGAALRSTVKSLDLLHRSIIEVLADRREIEIIDDQLEVKQV
jgi:hypothetical protein